MTSSENCELHTHTHAHTSTRAHTRAHACTHIHTTSDSCQLHTHTRARARAHAQACDPTCADALRPPRGCSGRSPHIRGCVCGRVHTQERTHVHNHTSHQQPHTITHSYTCTHTPTPYWDHTVSLASTNDFICSIGRRAGRRSVRVRARV